MNERGSEKLKRLLLIFLCALSLNGCGDNTVQNTAEDSFYERSEMTESELGENYQSKMDKIYNDAYERFTDPDSVEEMEGTDIFDKITRNFLSGYHRAYRLFRSMSPVIIVCSISAGILMMKLAKKNKKIRHNGLYIFIIGIPIAVIVIVFGLGIFNGVLLY